MGEGADGRRSGARNGVLNALKGQCKWAVKEQDMNPLWAIPRGETFLGQRIKEDEVFFHESGVM